MIVRFKSLGHQVSHLPLLNVEKINFDEINFSEFKGIIFTSANAVKSLDTKRINKKIFCFCVGSATEKKTRSLGFQNVISASGSVENLKELILQNFDKKNGKLIYLSGEIISANLDQQLVNEGYNVKRIINYRTKHIQKFDQKFIEDLKLNIPEIVYIYSENSAKTFYTIIKKYNLDNIWMETNLMCMGEKASAALNDIKWKKIFIFNSGEEEFLLYKI